MNIFSKKFNSCTNSKTLRSQLTILYCVMNKKIDVHEKSFKKENTKQPWMLKNQTLTLPMSRRIPEEFLGYWEKIPSLESGRFVVNLALQIVNISTGKLLLLGFSFLIF